MDRHPRGRSNATNFIHYGPESAQNKRAGGNSSLKFNGIRGRDGEDGEFEDMGESVAGRLRTTNVVPEFPTQYQGSESDKDGEFEEDGLEDGAELHETQKARKFRFRLKLGSNGPRLLSGAIAGAFSRSAVAPLETIWTHLMVGSHGRSVGEVFEWIVTNEGWQRCFEAALSIYSAWRPARPANYLLSTK
ncbi:hypothetical protein M758_1G007100 [Ceratodon purpureus]|nr:hypothetical protein M758_1G007100 [Ceratodon purpureus]